MFCEVAKQIANYSLQYFNGGHFPIPQTIMVITIELVKLIATVIRAGGQCPISKQGLSWTHQTHLVRSSFRFLIPSILYAINNNIYFFGLTLVAPPIWITLLSFRIILTATIYKVNHQIIHTYGSLNFINTLHYLCTLYVNMLP